MTARDRADDIVDDWYTEYSEVRASVKERRALASLILAALADAERVALRDLCGRLNSLEKYLRSARYAEALELTTNTASAIRSKTQATQEEG